MRIPICPPYFQELQHPSRAHLIQFVGESRKTDASHPHRVIIQHPENRELGLKPAAACLNGA
jgi:hypothetical protein